MIEDWTRGALNNVWEKKLGKQATSRRRQVRQAAIDELGHIWKRFTGKRPTRRVENPANTCRPRSYGPFQEFVKEALLPIFDNAGVVGIDRDIRQTCAVMDNNPDQPPPSYVHMKSQL
jgi:hypothetical protein